jgi:hypothetical protein
MAKYLNQADDESFFNKKIESKSDLNTTPDGFQVKDSVKYNGPSSGVPDSAFDVKETSGSYELSSTPPTSTTTDLSKSNNPSSLTDSNEVTRDDTENQKFYYGLDDESENIDRDLVNWSKALSQNSNRSDLLTGFKTTWDRRFGDAYSSTRSIGNNMPNGPEWVGSPSIMNQYALMRFDHIASRKHHKFLLDQMGQVGFRTTGMYLPSADVSDLGQDAFEMVQTTDNNGNMVSTQKKITNKDGESYSVVNKNSIPNDMQQKLKDSQGEVYSDADGGLFQIIKNENMEIWEPANPSAIVSGESKDPITIITNGSSDKTTPRPGVSGNGTSFSDALVTEYWAAQAGLVKCSASSGSTSSVGGWTVPEVCDSLKNPEKEISKENYAHYQTQINKMKTILNGHKKANWTFKGYQEEKYYIPKYDVGQPAVSEEIEPSFDNLCNFENWKGQEQFYYDWSDFLYTADMSTIPNNRLITLRRFPVPVMDHGRIPTQDDTKAYMLPVAKAVTWIGTGDDNQIGSLTSMTWKMNWEPFTASVNDINGNEQGSEEVGSTFGGNAEKIAKALGVVTGQANFDSISGKSEQMANFDPFKDGPYSNLPQGPVNVIMTSQQRKQGLEFEHGIKLKFVYSLKSIGGINPKAAMLDILANFLALTSNNAAFWGGANRYFPNKPAYPFLGAKKGMDAWYNGDVSGFVDAIGDQFTSALSNLGDALLSLFKDPMGAIAKLGGKGAQLWMAKKQAGKRPGILSFKSLLTGEAVGEWHLMVGNPFNPMMMIGNLIVRDATMSLSETLGPDDFPDKITFEVSLEHARPRDKGDIESIFNRGAGRLHYSYKGLNSEPWNSASSTKVSLNANKDGRDGQTIVNDGTTKSANAIFNNPNKTTGMQAPQSRTQKSSASQSVHSSNASKNATSSGISSWEEVFAVPFRNIKKVYGVGAKKAIQLAEKVGQKTASEDKK